MRDYENLLRKRILLNEECENNLELQATALKKCKEDKIFWFDNFAWTYDPRIVPSNLPFILYPKQIKFIQWLDDLLEKSRQGGKINAIVDKPRDIGATFTIMGWCLWHYLFDEFVTRVGSRKEDYVDKKGETDTLFYKLDYMTERLPAWMIPADWKNHRQYLMFGHPEKENAISGESANPNFGRGGRKSVTIFDELGFWQWAKSSWESSGESTNFRLAVSTPPETGRDSHFYKLSAGLKGKIEKFEFDWQDVPNRDEKWLIQQKDTKSDEEFQREVLKSFEGTVEGKVYALDFRFAKLTKVDYKPELPLFVSWDFGLDETAMIWLQKNFETNQVKIIDTYHNSNKAIDFFVPFVKGEIISGNHNYTEKELEIIERHSKWKSAAHYGDPDVKKRNLTDKLSVKDILGENDIYIQTHNRDSTDHLTIRERTKMLFRRLEISEDRCEYFIDAIRNSRYPERPEGSQATTPIKLPIHDWTCLAKGTKIRTLNGWKRIEDVRTRDYVWSYDLMDKRLRPAKVKGSKKTKTNAEVMEVGLDNGKSIKCTPDHRFMKRNGEYVEAQDLKPKDSLMPFYEYNDSGYIRIDLNDGTFAREHQYVYNLFNGYTEDGYVIDHKDGNHFNNSPDNLWKLTIGEHCKKTFDGLGHWDDRKDIDNTNYSREFYDRSAIYKFCEYCNKDFKGSHKTLYCSPECSRQAFKKRNYSYVCKGCGRKIRRGGITGLCRECYENTHLRKNHKVRYVKKIAERYDTYDLYIPQYNNFVAEGVVVHNSHFRTALEYFVDNEPNREPKGLILTEELKKEKETIEDQLFPAPQRDWRYD